MSALFFGYAQSSCPSCGALPAIMWRPGGAFQQRTECVCGRRTRWVMCGHDAEADATDDEVLTAEDME